MAWIVANLGGEWNLYVVFGDFDYFGREVETCEQSTSWVSHFSLNFLDDGNGMTSIFRGLLVLHSNT